MNLNQKYILPKSQMTINSLLAEHETQNHQLNFSHEDFSLQIKYNHLLSINFYEPDLQDVQWNIEFSGIKNLDHVTVSQYKRKRIRLLYVKNNSLYFYEGHLTSKQNKYTLRESLLKSEKVIPLSDLQNNDQVLFISQDLKPNEKAGLFIICTVNNHFYILKGNSDLYQLIDLNLMDIMSKIFSSIAKIFKQKSSQNLTQNQQQKVSYLSLRKPQHKQEYFKIIVLRNFMAQTRLISLPVLPGQKCQRQIIFTNSINFLIKLRQTLQLAPEDSINISASQMYRLSEVEAVILFLLQKDGVNDDDCYNVVSFVYNFEKNQIISINDLPIFSIDVKEVEFIQIPQTHEIIIKVQHIDRVILNHVQMETLRLIQTQTFKIQGPTILCESKINERLILLSPYQVLDINMKQHGMENDSQMQEQENGGMRSQKIGSLGSISQLHKNLNENRQKLQNLKSQNKISQIKRIIDNLLFEIDNIIKQITSTNRQNIAIEQIITIYITLLMYKTLIEKQAQFFSITKKKVQINFDDLIRKNFGEITQVLQTVEKQKQIFNDFIQLWISIIEQIHAKFWFQNDQIRKILSQLINDNFSHIINGSLEKYLGQSLENQADNVAQKQIFLHENVDNLLLHFIKSTSGIIRIERENYRRLIFRSNKKEQLKIVAINIVNIDLLTIFYFQSGLISTKQLENAFKSIPSKNQYVIQNFIETFLSQFIGRLKNNEIINQNAKNLNNLISIFANHEQIIKRVVSQSDSYLYILTALKYGQRQKVKEDIKRTIETMKKKQNQQKLQLIIGENQGQKMDEE